MNIPETHIPNLRFKIYIHAPKSCLNKWKELKDICEYNNNDENKKIVKDWLSFCDNEKIKEMPYLNRCEGGIGGDNNIKHKQMRFRQYIYLNKDNDIVFDQIYNTNDEKWTFKEFDDLILGFIKYANDYIKGDYVDGVIELTNKDLYYKVFSYK
jgi:hypothetical protein